MMDFSRYITFYIVFYLLLGEFPVSFGVARWSSLVVSLLDVRFGVKIPARAEIWFKISPNLCLLANSAVMSTLTAHCQWKDETVRERTGHPLSYAKAKKIKLITLHTHGSHRASLRDSSSSSSLSYSWKFSLSQEIL